MFRMSEQDQPQPREQVGAEHDVATPPPKRLRVYRCGTRDSVAGRGMHARAVPQPIEVH
jgi:hypothetical protein